LEGWKLSHREAEKRRDFNVSYYPKGKKEKATFGVAIKKKARGRGYKQTVRKKGEKTGSLRKKRAGGGKGQHAL